MIIIMKKKSTKGNENSHGTRDIDSITTLLLQLSISSLDG